MRALLSILLISASLLISCNKANQPSKMLLGTWKYVYEVLPDGSKDYDNPYALLQFEYSDGFVLYEDGTGNTMWYDQINDPERYNWQYKGEELMINPPNTSQTFEFQIMNLTADDMYLTTPGGKEYYITKQ